MRYTSIVASLALAGLVSVSAAAQAAEDTKPAPAPPSVSNADYRLGPGDKLRIEVYKDPQLSQSVQIRPDGKITMPLIGDLDATGNTPIELRDRIAKSLKEYITNPTVTVIVVEAESAHAYVMGEVTRPGAIPLNGPTTVLQALAIAGGFKDFANTKDVKVLRPTATGVQTLRFNYKDVVNGDAKPFLLHAGDTVIVP
jgi:polysaccharide export outer membrane protein